MSVKGRTFQILLLSTCSDYSIFVPLQVVDFHRPLLLVWSGGLDLEDGARLRHQTFQKWAELDTGFQARWARAPCHSPTAVTTICSPTGHSYTDAYQQDHPLPPAPGKTARRWMCSIVFYVLTRQPCPWRVSIREEGVGPEQAKGTLGGFPCVTTKMSTETHSRSVPFFHWGKGDIFLPYLLFLASLWWPVFTFRALGHFF